METPFFPETSEFEDYNTQLDRELERQQEAKGPISIISKNGKTFTIPNPLTKD